MQAALRVEASVYRRHEPEKTVLYRVMAEHLETFLARTREEGDGLPRYVEDELRAYLECGILAYGFVRLRCDCGESRVVPFSCQGRGFCPSCMGRRMADTAARLVDDVIPRVPVRQWVLSLPIELRYRLSYDGALVSATLAIFLRAVRGWYVREAKALGHDDVQHVFVTFVQRFGSALNGNVHFHALALDGVYSRGESGELDFVTLRSPNDEDVRELVEALGRRVIALFERRGFSYADEDPLATTSKVLAGLLSASTRGLLSGGRRLRRVLSDPKEGVRTGHLCCAASGFSLHAATSIEAYDRKRLEELCRYAQRPPLAMGSLEMLSQDLLSFRMKAPWDDGTTHILLSPMDLIERLAALVPPPRAHLVRYHGILAPNAKDRAKVVPAGEPTEGASQDGKDQAEAKAPPRRASARLLWAVLLARIFNIQGEKCPRCGRKMKLVAALTNPASIRKYLEGVGLPAEPPTISPARPPPQLDLDFAD